MPYVLGVDIGTSFTAAAVTRLGGDSVAAPSTLGLGLRGGAVPTVVFLGEDGQILVGEAAERRGLECPERMVREFKRRIGDSVPFVIGGVSITAEDLFATMARWVVDRAAEREGEPPAAVTLSHPASWGAYKTGGIRSALAGVGLADVVLLSEPEAAALHYASQERIEPGRTIAVYDLGGGTFDAAVLRKNDTETFTVLGRPGGIERLGGADFDQAVFTHVAAGAGAAFAGLDPTDPGVLSALARIRRECTEAKEALSADSEATIPVLLPEAHSSVRLVRSEFESMIEDPVRETFEVLTSVLKDAGVEAGDLDAILLIGGSSRIPLIAELLSEELDRPIAIDADPKASISLGAAFAAAGLVEEDTDADEARTAASVPGVLAAPARPSFAAGAAPILSAAATPGRARTGLRIGAVAVAAAMLTGLTATAAQSPRFFGALSAVAEAGSDSGTPSPSTAEPGTEDGSGGGGSTDAPDESWFSQLTNPSGLPATTDGPPPRIAAPAPSGAPSPKSAEDVTAKGSGTGAKDSPDSGDGAADDGEPDEAAVADAGTAEAEGTNGPSSTPAPPETPDPTPGAAPSSPAPSPAPAPAAPDPTTPLPAPDPTSPPAAPEPTTPPPAPDPSAPTTPAPDPTMPPATEPGPTAPGPITPEPTTPDPAPAPEPDAGPTTAPADPVPAEPVPADPAADPGAAVEPDPAAPPEAPEG